MVGATLFGKPLTEGGTIGVAAPASPYDSRSQVLRGVEWWEARGYRVQLAPGIWERDDYVAGSPQQRANDLNGLFADPEVDVVPALHVAILRRTGLATIYGNGLNGVGSANVTEFSKQRLLDVLREGGAGEVPPDPDDPWLRVIRGGKATAPLVGGCLWILMQTLATPWELDLDGAIL